MNIWKNAAIIMTLVIILGSGLGCTKSPEEDELLKRGGAVQSWFDGAEEVESKIDGELRGRVKTILDYLHSSVFIVKPSASEKGLLVSDLQEVPAVSYPIAITAITANDAKLSTAWKGAYENSQWAFLVPVNKIPLLVLKNDIKSSRLFKGMLLIHEGCHAVDYSNGALKKISSFNIERASSEYSAYMLEILILRKIGGEKYEDLIKEKMEDIRNNPDNRAKYSWYDKKLDIIFGKSLSEDEKSSRRFLVTLDAIFRLAELEYGKESTKVKIDMLLELYSKKLLE